MQQRGIGREGDVLGLHGGIDNNAGEVCGLHPAGAGRHLKAFPATALAVFPRP
jgi:hypothetical protein